MNTKQTILLASVAALSLCAATSPYSNQLRKLPAQGLARVPSESQSAFEAEAWKQKLLEPDLDQRERHENSSLSQIRPSACAACPRP